MHPVLSSAPIVPHSSPLAVKNKSAPIIKREIQSQRIALPLAGLGSFKMEQARLVEGLKKGFKLIDTAKAYGNEEDIKTAIRISGLDQVQVITKLFNPNVQSLEKLRGAVLDSNQKLGQVPEIFLIHGPYPDVHMLSMLHELEALKKEGKVKNWGVSNFDIEHLEVLIKNDLTPVLNQVEYHPYFQRPELLDFCKAHNIILQAYRPLAEGKVLNDPAILSLAWQHNVSPATLVYSWLAQQDIAIVTKVSSGEHQDEYANSGLIKLTDQQLKAMAALHVADGKGRTCTKGGWYVPFTEDVLRMWVAKPASL